MMTGAAAIAEAEAMMARHEREHRDLMLRQRAEAVAFYRTLSRGDAQSEGRPICQG